ncbi:MAG: hypothetical protein ACRC46_01340 [Thermoguttaceae bacterium]
MMKQRQPAKCLFMDETQATALIDKVPECSTPNGIGEEGTLRRWKKHAGDSTSAQRLTASEKKALVTVAGILFTAEKVLNA